ncbi:hypothetical protein HMPREF0497_0780 [Lentilactobacillus buchneri ATCC 11577]|uniref:Uncharacterized protein n=1 Tax=Lentilactobacillus hilgardii (strain ATCC 8290 / DSM 20176 / CCUG 30140 / JCM 1155 / KCTC 3500 / NBRC 15886 / NCIMB 8040 / NRRL B-1843 / 9) TaxID=1423757 RepID=C0XK09_LENH9|nr:hypothetical protein HMPREF0497_0780 [Lentilactobacillus buchneri ATCC 11577]EEI24277.1 hypothetical protein HMPREF0519_1570 [Lentilactobacillus hilgardii DSM 20176 = ATCC 8290]KRK56687.1 hypothetical protein FD42_GL000227 [Lentilactobacillus hilgardii DSM 20176 = ATCC 8290]
MDIGANIKLSQLQNNLRTIDFTIPDDSSKALTIYFILKNTNEKSANYSFKRRYPR